MEQDGGKRERRVRWDQALRVRDPGWTVVEVRVPDLVCRVDRLPSSSTSITPGSRVIRWSMTAGTAIGAPRRA